MEPKEFLPALPGQAGEAQVQHPPLLDLLRLDQRLRRALLAAGHAGPAAAGRAAGGGYCRRRRARASSTTLGRVVTGSISFFQKNSDANEETERQAIAELLSPCPTGCGGN